MWFFLGIAPKNRPSAHGQSTCCHDDSCQDFPPRMGRGKVVCELTEFIHHQARDGVSQNLQTHGRAFLRWKTWKTHKHKAPVRLHLLLVSRRTRCTCQKVCSTTEARLNPRPPLPPPKRCSSQPKMMPFQQTMTVLKYLLLPDSGSQINALFGAPKESNCKRNSSGGKKKEKKRRFI